MSKNLSVLTFSCISIIGILYLASCHSSAKQVKQNDTTIALKMLLDSAFYKPSLARAAQLSDSAFFHDTIILLRNKILIGHLPANLPHKFLTEDGMCRYMAKHKKGGLQFLALDEFTKTPNGYQMALGTHCMHRGEIIKYPENSVDTICEREKYCNAVLHMKVGKKKGAFVASEPGIVTY